MFDNYDYFACNLRYVINVTHRNLRYGASRLFINLPIFSQSMTKKSLQICSLVILSATSPSSPRRCREEVKERRRHTSLQSTAKEEEDLPLVVLRRGGSRQHRLQAVVLRLQAQVSALSLPSNFAVFYLFL